ncbi:MAG: trimethylamine methyltransferase family protein [Thermacetogeniaceae bacterium]
MKFEYFNDVELEKMHEATVEILKRIGISTTSTRLKELLLDNGCKEKGERIVFPEDVIDKALKTVPPKFNIYGRNGCDLVIEMGERKAYAEVVVGPPSIIDLDNCERRDVSIKDVGDFAKLADALENIHIVSPIFPRDVPQELIVTMETVAILRNTSKPQRICVESSHELPYIIEVLAAAAGGMDALRKRPIAYLEISTISPLNSAFHPAEALIDIVEAGLPLGIVPCPMMGGTGPITLAGCVAQHNAEILSSVIASQLLKPGAPVVMSPRVTFMDMKTGLGLWAMPEQGLAAAASAQLAKYYNIPSTVTGYSCAAKTADAQSGYEHLYNALLPALIGVDVLAAAGSLDNCLLSCYAMLVIDDELSSVIQRTLKGSEVNEDTLAIDVIEEVINTKGTFLSHKHTRRHLHAGELWVPPIGDRSSYENWAIKKQKLEDKAREKAKELLATHEVVPLTPEADEEIDEILKRAQKEFNLI